ncbi:MAG TPA: hypothetical protein VES40_19985, partial [Ilumatobacteraceae bacterium]|nr:hypothetical protein [Ilumatobacteraceae bacterium]
RRSRMARAASRPKPSTRYSRRRGTGQTARRERRSEIGSASRTLDPIEGPNLAVLDSDQLRSISSLWRPEATLHGHPMMLSAANRITPTSSDVLQTLVVLFVVLAVVAVVVALLMLRRRSANRS